MGRGGAGAKKLYTNFHVTPTEVELELGCDNTSNNITKLLLITFTITTITKYLITLKTTTTTITATK